MSNSMYRDEILEHYRSPMNFGRLDFFSYTSKQLNPFCGDEVEMFINIEKGRVADVSFVGKGCAIAIASASILTEYAKGKAKNQLTKFTQEDMLLLLGIEVSETRKKCALLGHSVLWDCLNQT